LPSTSGSPRKKPPQPTVFECTADPPGHRFNFSYAASHDLNQESTEFDARESFNRAVDAHRSGNLDFAEQIYREILKAQPENVHAIHLLGVVALQKGRPEDACELIQSAIKRDDSHALFHCNLGEAYRLSGRLEKAEECFCAALDRQPRYPQALMNLGVTLHQRGRHEEAVSRFQQLLEMEGPSADLYSNLGLAQFASGAVDQAIVTLRQAIDLDSNHLEANNNLGAALLEKGDVEAAVFVLEQSIRVDPRSADAWSNLARARLDQAALETAEQCARRAIQLAPGQAKFHLVLGMVLSQARRPGEAEFSLQRALELAPDQALTHYLLGTVLMRVGRFDEAEAALGQATRLNPELTVAHEALSYIHTYGVDDLPEIARLEHLAESLDAGTPARIHLEFALAKMLDDCEQYHRAFLHLQTANELRRSQLSFDASDLWQILEHSKRTLDRPLIERVAQLGSESEIPILIVGMPRSGTTLVEQILASHPRVSAAGEVGYLAAAAQRIARQSGVDYPACLGGLNDAVIRTLVDEYLLRLEKHRRGARYVTDTRPHDFVHLGLYSMLFPKGRIVHCVRDPLDTCFSTYRQSFERENEFAYRLEDIADYYRFYRLMMEHWQAVLPSRMFDVHYEELVEDQEHITRKLIDHCELPWDDHCLRPHETDREIRSANYWQVRQPVYNSSLSKWRCYERHLAPLVEALDRYGYASNKT
jgi:tetratricopeptide (TPR) repeat protein